MVLSLDFTMLYGLNWTLRAMKTFSIDPWWTPEAVCSWGTRLSILFLKCRGTLCNTRIVQVYQSKMQSQVFDSQASPLVLLLPLPLSLSPALTLSNLFILSSTPQPPLNILPTSSISIPIVSG